MSTSEDAYAVRRRPGSSSEDSILASEVLHAAPAPVGEVTDAEIVDVLSLLQLTTAIVFFFMCSLGLMVHRVEKRLKSDSIPGLDVIICKLVESGIAMIAAMLIKFAPSFNRCCCPSSTIAIGIIRFIAIIIEFMLVVTATVALFWPPKSQITPIAMGTIYFFEIGFLTIILFFLIRLVISGKHLNKSDPDNTSHSRTTESSMS